MGFTVNKKKQPKPLCVQGLWAVSVCHYDLDRFRGQYHLGIYCEWRLQENGKPITGSCEPNELDGPMVKGLSRLIGKSITSVAITADCGDLDIAFEDMGLQVFCNYAGQCT